MRSAGDWPIHDRVLLVRLFSVLLASMAIPFTFLAARGVLGSGADLGYGAAGCRAGFW